MVTSNSLSDYAHCISAIVLIGWTANVPNEVVDFEVLQKETGHVS